MAYDRDTLRTLAAARLGEAKVLFGAGQPSGAYYLAGYAIECAIKARIAGQFRANEIPERKLINNIYTHDLSKLLELAGLQAEIDLATQGDDDFRQKWTVVRVGTGPLRNLEPRGSFGYDRCGRRRRKQGRLIPMADQSLVEKKLDISFQLAAEIAKMGKPLLAAYWEWHDEPGRWELVLVPKSAAEERNLINAAVDVLRRPPFRSVFSLLDVKVSDREIKRAQALASFVRAPEDIGRRYNTTFTGGEYFESVIIVYLAPELQRHHHVA